MGSWSNVYDAASNLTTRTDALGQVASLGYDALNRVSTKSITRNGGLPAEATAYSYDQATTGFHNVGQLTTVSRTVGGGSTGSFAYNYDNGGQLVAQTMARDELRGSIDQSPIGAWTTQLRTVAAINPASARNTGASIRDRVKRPALRSLLCFPVGSRGHGMTRFIERGKLPVRVAAFLLRACHVEVVDRICIHRARQYRG